MAYAKARKEMNNFRPQESRSGFHKLRTNPITK